MIRLDKQIVDNVQQTDKSCSRYNEEESKVVNPFTPSLISRTVSVDVKDHVYLLYRLSKTKLRCCEMVPETSVFRARMRTQLG